MIIHDEDDDPARGLGWALVAATAVAILAAAFILAGFTPIVGPLILAGRIPEASIIVLAIRVVAAVLIFAFLYVFGLRGRAPERGAEYFLVLLIGASVTNIGIMVFANWIVHRAPVLSA